MKTLAQIEKLADLDSRVINASAHLETELRSTYAGIRQNATLGDLVQRQDAFQENGFIRDVNFALSVRNAIAHLADGVEPLDDEKQRAADYLIRAIKLLRRKNSANADEVAAKPQAVDRFDDKAVRAAIRAIYRGRVTKAGCLAFLIAIGTLGYCATADDYPSTPMIRIGGLIVAGIVSISGRNRTINQKEYYTLPGSRFDDGDHRCIYCGRRARDGRGIYTHGRYKSDVKFHDCSKCKSLLYNS